MHYLTSLKHRIPFLISLLIGLTFAAPAPPTSAHAPAGSPLRLRLRIDSNTLHPNQTTKIYADFLDRDYQQVPSDGTRVIEFALKWPGSKQAGSGELSPQRVTVRPGQWSGEATFVSRQPGRLFVMASSDGLDSSQTPVLITGHQRSFLSQLFETVAYAQSQNEIQIDQDTYPSAPANNKFQANIWVLFSEAQQPGTIVRIRTDPCAGIVYKNQRAEGHMDITVDNVANSDSIGISSATPGIVTVSAYVRSDGPRASAQIKFDPPEAAKIIFDSEPQSIGLDDRDIPISVQLADEGGFPLAIGNDQVRKIRVSSALDPKLVDFEPQTIVLAQGRTRADSVLHLKQAPSVAEMKLLARDEGNTGIKGGQKIITVQRPIPVSASWLLFMAVLGGAIGGLARQLHQGDRLARILPLWTGTDWNLGLSGRIMGSVVSGLFLYWAIKLGLAQVTFDLGTKTVAFFFGGIGGFAGLVVLAQLEEWCFKLLRWTPLRRDRSVAALASPEAAATSASLEKA
jgi:hypothetical protein